MKGRATSFAKSVGSAAANRVERFIDSTLEKRLESLTGLVPINHTKPTDVHICGYPKSGNTWFQHLAAAVVYGVNVELAPDTLLNELVPDVHFKRYYRRFGDPCFFKSHHLPRPDYRRIVYLLRDGRDAMVSYYHHLSATSGPIDFRRLVEGGEGLFPGKWHAHVEGYLANPFGADMIVIRYEDLKRDPLAELQRFCQFARIERDEETLVSAVGRTTFERMQSKEKKSGWETPGWPKDKLFVRRGKVGSYRDEMPAEVLQAFMRDAERTLVTQGYL